MPKFASFTPNFGKNIISLESLEQPVKLRSPFKKLKKIMQENGSKSIHKATHLFCIYPSLNS